MSQLSKKVNALIVLGKSKSEIETELKNEFGLEDVQPDNQDIKKDLIR